MTKEAVDKALAANPDAQAGAWGDVTKAYGSQLATVAQPDAGKPITEADIDRQIADQLAQAPEGLNESQRTRWEAAVREAGDQLWADRGGELADTAGARIKEADGAVVAAAAAVQPTLSETDPAHVTAVTHLNQAQDGARVAREQSDPIIADHQRALQEYAAARNVSHSLDSSSQAAALQGQRTTELAGRPTDAEAIAQRDAALAAQALAGDNINEANALYTATKGADSAADGAAAAQATGDPAKIEAARAAQGTAEAVRTTAQANADVYSRSTDAVLNAVRGGELPKGGVSGVLADQANTLALENAFSAAMKHAEVKDGEAAVGAAQQRVQSESLAPARPGPDQTSSDDLARLPGNPASSPVPALGNEGLVALAQMDVLKAQGDLGNLTGQAQQSDALVEASNAVAQRTGLRHEMVVANDTAQAGLAQANNQATDTNAALTQLTDSGASQDQIDAATVEHNRALEGRHAAQLEADQAADGLSDSNRFNQAQAELRAAQASGNQAAIDAAQGTMASFNGAASLADPATEGTALSGTRAQLAEDAAQYYASGGADDPAFRGALRLEFADATSEQAVPGLSVDRLTEEIKARRPGDPAFARAVDEVAFGKFEMDAQDQPVLDAAGLPKLIEPGMVQTWDVAGRSADVFEPMKDAVTEASGTGNWTPVSELAKHQLDTMAGTKPTVESTQLFADMVRQYGSDNPNFRQAVTTAENQFLRTDPQDFAAQVAQAFEQGGPEAATKKLREGTDLNLNPVTAGLNFKASTDTLGKVLPFVGDPLGNFSFGPFGAGREDLAGLPATQRMFGDLSAAADSAWRSPDAQTTVSELARGLAPLASNPQLARDAVADGDRPTLSYEIANQITLNAERLRKPDGSIAAADRPEYDASITRADRMVASANEGINDFRNEIVYPAAGEFIGRVLPIKEPADQFGKYVTPEGAARAMQSLIDNPSEDVHKANDALTRLEPIGLQYLRTLDSTREFADKFAPQGNFPGLPSHTALREQIKGVENDGLAYTALTAAQTNGPEALRAQNVNGEGTLDPLKVQQLYDRALATYPDIQADQPNAVYKAAMLTGVTALTSLPVYSTLKFPETGGIDLRARGLSYEQAPRSFGVGLTVQDPWFSNSALDWAAKSAANDAIALLSGSALNHSRLARNDPAVYRIPPPVLASRMFIGPIASGVQNFAIRPAQANGTLPTADVGANGERQWNSFYDWTLQQLPGTINQAISYGAPNIVSSAFIKGGRDALGIDGKVAGDTAKLKDLAARFNPAFAANPESATWRGAFNKEVASNVFTKEAWAAGLKNGKTFGAIFGANYMMTQFLIDRPWNSFGSDVPPVMDPLLGGPYGTAAVSAATGGFLLGTFGQYIPGKAGEIVSKGGAKAGWAGLAATGVLGAIDDEVRAAQFEASARRWLTDTGEIDPKIAEELANYSPEGRSIRQGLDAMSNRSGTPPLELMNEIENLSPEQVSEVVGAINAIRTDGNGGLIESDPSRNMSLNFESPVLPWDDSFTVTDGPPQGINTFGSVDLREIHIPSNVKPETVQGLFTWLNHFYPELLMR